MGGGSISVPATIDGAPLYTFYSYTVTATGPLTGLSFATTSGVPDNLLLDDVSVVPAAVPEASTTVSLGLLLALGMGGVFMAAKRKKAVSALQTPGGNGCTDTCLNEQPVAHELRYLCNKKRAAAWQVSLSRYGRSSECFCLYFGFWENMFYDKLWLFNYTSSATTLVS